MGKVTWIFNPFDDIPGEGKPQRYWRVAEELARRGHEVVWWSSDFSHRRKERRTTPDGKEIAFTIRLVATPAYQRNISLARIRNHRVFGRRLVVQARKAVASGELAKPDLILTSLPPLEGPVAALELRQEFGCGVVTDVMDAWPETFLQALPGNRGIRSVGSLLSRSYWAMVGRACQESDAVSAQSETFAAFARKHGAKGEIEVCYLGADRPERESPLATEPTEDGRAGQHVCRFLYLGAMGRSYDLDTVLSAFARLQAEDGIDAELVLVGDGEKREALEARNIRNVRFTGYLDGDALVRELVAADVGLVPFFPESGVAVPYKAGEYLAYGLPVLSSLDGELGELIRRFGCGAVYSPEDVAGLAAKMREYARAPERRLRESEQSGRLFQEKFDRATIYPSFADWLERVGDVAIRRDR